MTLGITLSPHFVQISVLGWLPPYPTSVKHGNCTVAYTSNVLIDIGVLHTGLADHEEISTSARAFNCLLVLARTTAPKDLKYFVASK